MIRTPSPRSRLARFKRLLAALALPTLMQGGAAWAGPFTLDTYAETFEPSAPTAYGMIPVQVVLGMSVDGEDWYMKSFAMLGPVNERGEELDFHQNQYLQWYDLEWETGVVAISLGHFQFWPGGAYGRFTGGEIAVTAARYAEGDFFHLDPIEERTITASFGFVVPGPAASAPEPAAVIPALVAAVGGAAIVAVRRCRRAG